MRFVFWNTSLSPIAKRRSNPDLESYQALINYFLDTLSVEVLALCEVSEDDLALIHSCMNVSEYKIHSGIEKIGRSQFETCVIYKWREIRLIDIKRITVEDENRNYRAAQRLELAVQGVVTTIRLYISHWPSQRESSSARVRCDLAVALRKDLDRILDSDELAACILLGDYNDEPFNESIINHLKSSRDRELVSRKKKLLYNPFWRHLGALPDSDYNNEVAGSYFYGQDPRDRWRTFDQICFTPSLLSNGPWLLVDDETNILNIDWYTDMVMQSKSHYDHLPVTCKLSYRGE